MKNKTVTATEALKNIGDIKFSGFEIVVNKMINDQIVIMSRDMVRAMFDLSYIDIKKWHGSDTRSVVRFHQHYGDNGTILIYWKK